MLFYIAISSIFLNTNVILPVFTAQYYHYDQCYYFDITERIFNRKIADVFANMASGDQHVLKRVQAVPQRRVTIMGTAIVQLGNAVVIQDGEEIVLVMHVPLGGLVLIVQYL